MINSENNYENPSQSLEQVKRLLDEVRPTLFERLEKLTNPYHNKQHMEEVAQNIEELLNNLNDPNLFNNKQKLLIIEAALRHDDGHSGNTFRQEVSGDNLSNEEYAVALLKQDLQGKLEEDDLKYIEGNILATTFGQNDMSKLPKDSYFRSYKAETPSQKLLALADISGFTKGWEKYMDTSLLIFQESPKNIPRNIDEWLMVQQRFISFYISPLLAKVEDLLQPIYFEQLQGYLKAILEKLEELKNESNSQRAIYKAKLETIRIS